MKTKFLGLICLLLLGIAYGCSDDDTDFGFVDDVTKEAFLKDFPEATGIKWEKKQDYYVAEFYVEKHEMEAWYDNAGKLYITEKDISKEELPATVQEALKKSAYADWKIDDIDQYNREGYETLYIIEVERGEDEVDLVYNEEGVLLKEIVDNPGGHNPGDYIIPELPSGIKDYLDKNHKNARIVDVDRESAKWEVEIVEDRVKKELDFDKDGKTWLQTKWEIKENEIPEAVKTGIKNSQYADWEIDDVDYITNLEGEFYKIEFEKKGQKDVEVVFKVDGSIVGK